MTDVGLNVFVGRRNSLIGRWNLGQRLHRVVGHIGHRTIGRVGHVGHVGDVHIISWCSMCHRAGGCQSRVIQIPDG